MRIFTDSRVLWTIFLLIVVFPVSMPAYAQYSGGTGEPNDPYQIATAQDLIALGEAPDDYDKHFILTADIDLSSYTFERAVIAPDVNDDEHWYQGTAFTGIFDGNGHTISHLRIEGGGCLGLFGQLGSGANISNLGLEAVDVNGTSSNIGGLVGGNNDGNIVNCYSSGSVNGGISRTGGLVGGNNDGNIIRCHSNIIIEYGGEDVGGLVCGNSGSITMSYSTGSVNGYDNIGGLVCGNSGSITMSFSSCGGQGGLVAINSGTITNCYSTDTSIWGSCLVNYNYGSITNCYSTSCGLVGVNWNGTVLNCFWDIETSGQVTSDGGTGLTTAEMQTESTFTDAGWDFVGETVNGPNDIWKIIEGQTYPLLSWQKYGGGTGDANYPYLIYTAEHLNDLGTESNDYDKHFKLMADIDLSEYLYDKAVIAPDENDDEGGFQGAEFTGVFNGSGHSISHLAIDGVSYVGLFGQLGSEALVYNLGMEAVNINGIDGGYVGSLVGMNGADSSIMSCYSTGLVHSCCYVGGLVGFNKGIITSSYNKCTVSGCEDVGGLVGWNDSHITDCYNTGSLGGAYAIGGLVGSGSGVVLSSFWDTETSGSTYPYGGPGPWSAGGTGLTTAEMQMQSTFIDAGWDFVGETVNGTEDIWTICEGTNYPKLVWQISPADFVCPDGITLDDFGYFMDHWEDDVNCESSNGYCDGTDLDFSGTVDIYDLAILLDYWLAEN